MSDTENERMPYGVLLLGFASIVFGFIVLVSLL
jgi:hypothetical protein